MLCFVFNSKFIIIIIPVIFSLCLFQLIIYVFGSHSSFTLSSSSSSSLLQIILMRKLFVHILEEMVLFLAHYRFVCFIFTS
ncbi:hypothetical protein RIF29_36056 [Crotalaria pallida]|uniref:Uncharacterized protein n=1 Tax=Crotalaria pallida TaxID=3830 RepID=A0AAN9EH19_CROPI